MKTTITINIQGRLFHIDNDAYDLLSRYLKNISNNLGSNNEKQEILNDIENRIAELFQDRMNSSKTIIDITDVEYIMKTIGSPIEIGEVNQDEQESSSRQSYYTGNKRMFRDTEHNVFGGVCSGMAKYFNLDPVIIRVVFVIAFLGFGVGILIYIILWAIIPAAITEAEKHEMNHSSVRFSDVAQNIKKEFRHAKI